MPLSGPRLSVLFVDDDQDVLDCFGHYLKVAGGLDVSATTNPHVALRMARDQDPDVIILDVAMPYLDGCTLIDALQDAASTSRIPVVIFTGMPAEEACKGRSVAACVQKPCAPDRLLAAVQMVAMPRAS